MSVGTEVRSAQYYWTYLVVGSSLAPNHIISIFPSLPTVVVGLIDVSGLVCWLLDPCFGSWHVVSCIVVDDCQVLLMLWLGLGTLVGAWTQWSLGVKALLARAINLELWYVTCWWCCPCMCPLCWKVWSTMNEAIIHMQEEVMGHVSV